MLVIEKPVQPILGCLRPQAAATVCEQLHRAQHYCVQSVPIMLHKVEGCFVLQLKQSLIWIYSEEIGQNFKI